MREVGKEGWGSSGSVLLPIRVSECLIVTYGKSERERGEGGGAPDRPLEKCHGDLCGLVGPVESAATRSNSVIFLTKLV